MMESGDLSGDLKTDLASSYLFLSDVRVSADRHGMDETRRTVSGRYHATMREPSVDRVIATRLS